MAEFNLFDMSTWGQTPAPAGTPAAPVEPAPVPMEKIQADLNQIKAALSSPKAMAAFAVSRQRGNGLTAGNVVLDDYNSMSPVAFQQKYGVDVYRDVGAAEIGSREVLAQANPERDPLTVIGDALVGANQGFKKGVLGLVNFGANVALPDSMPGKDGILKWTVDQAKIVDEVAAANTSDALNVSKQFDAIRTALDKVDEENNKKADKANDTNFVDWLESEGRAFLESGGNAGKRLLEDPNILGDLAAQGAGSMLVGGPATKGVTALAKAGGGASAAAAGNGTLFPLVIGAMSGGGAAMQAQQSVMDMPDDELFKQPAFQALRQAGLSQEEARNELAIRAGEKATLPAAAVGAASGKLVEKIEMAPFAQTTAGGLAMNAGKETLEEGIQSAAEQLSANAGIKISGANEDQDLTEGLGASVVQGAVAGGATTLAMQGPGAAASLAARGAVEALSASVKAMNVPVEALKRRGEENLAQTAAKSPVSPENVSKAVNAAKEAAPAVAEAVRAMGAGKAEGETIEAYIERISAALDVSQDEIDMMPAAVKQQVDSFKAQFGGMPTSFDAMTFAANAAINPEAAQADRVATGTFILKSLARNKQLFDEDLPKFLESTPQDRPEYKAFENYAKTLKAIEQVPQIQEVLNWAREEMRQPDQDLSGVDLSTPAGQQAIKQAVDLASVAPQAVNPKVADQLLNQSRGDSNLITPEQRRILAGAKALHDAEAIYAEAAPTAQKTTNGMRVVDEQIESIGGPKQHQMSLVQHAQRINEAAASGNQELLKERVDRLRRFALSHRNKAAALNRSIRTGEQNVKYRAADPFGNSYVTKKGVGVVLGNVGSEDFARKVHANARSIAALTNSYMQLYPDLGMTEVAVPELLLDKTKADAKGSSQASEPVSSSQATTSRTDTNSKQAELPSQPPKPTREPEVVAPAEEPATKSSTNQRREDAQQAPVGADPAKTVSSLSAEEAQRRLDDLNEQMYQTTDDEMDAREALERQMDDVLDRLDELIALANTQPEEEAAVEPVAAATDAAPTPMTDAEVVELIENYDDNGRPGELTTAEAFPNLVQPAGRNYFHEAFKLPRVARSRLMQLVNVFQEMRDALASKRDIRAFAGRELKYKVSPEEAASMQFLVKVGDDVLKTMKANLREALMGKGSRLQRLANGEDLIHFPEMRALNILEKTEKGYRYNQQLVESAVLAGLDWALNAADRTVPVSRSDIAQILEIDEAQVDDTLEGEFNRGLSLDMAARSLSDNIQKFWGVVGNKEADDAYVKGIPEAVAKEVLYGLNAVGLIELGIKHSDTDDRRLAFPSLSKKAFNRVWFDTRPKDVAQFVRSVDGVSSLLADMALVEREPEGLQVGSPITEIDATQLRNPMVPTTEQQRKAIAHAQATPHLPNDMVFDFFEAMGLEAFVELMSGYPYRGGDLGKTHTEVGFNKGHWESVKGLQRSLVASYTNVTKQMAQVRKQGRVPVFYKHHINKLGRLQMAGLSNPQSDKLAREIFMATKSVLDLSENGKDFDKFAMTIGQGIGIKTEKVPRREVVQEVIDRTMLAGGDLVPLVLAMKEHLKSKTKTVSPETVELLRAAKLTLHGVHSVLAVAKFELARERGEDLSKFETFTYLEADGKTNGPINALMLMATGPITAAWLKAVGKGGVYFARAGKTLNSHKDKEDLYQAGAVEAQKRLAALGETLRNTSKETGEIFTSFQRFLAALDLNVDFDANSGELTLKRGITKNPLTITIYGSGEKGIAGKVLDELVKAFYEKMSEASQTGEPVGDLIYGTGNDALFMEDLARLTSTKVVKNTKTGKWFTVGDVQGISGTKEDFLFNTEQYAVLRDNVRAMLVTPMREAIDETVSKHVAPVRKALQESTQVQSVFLKALFVERVATRIAMKKANPDKYDHRQANFLSQQELEDILRSLMPFSPVINTGTQSYFMSGGEKADLVKKIEITIDGKTQTVSMPEDFSRALSGAMSTPAFAYGPTLAGVKAIPTMVVGSGDGQMMLNFLANNPEAANRVGHVFDGLNMPADAIEDYSRLVNQAVFETWTENANPIRAAYESFKAFVDRNPISVLFGSGEAVTAQQKQALLEISQAFHGRFQVKEEEILTVAEAGEFLQKTLARMKVAADETDARRMTYAQVMMSVDQMASAESPYTNPGELKALEEISEEDLAPEMNELFKANLAKVQKGEVPASAAEPVAAHGSPDDTGVRVIEANELPALFKTLEGKLTPTQKEMMRQASKLLAGSKYKVVIGKPSQLDSWELAYNEERFVPGSNSERGKIDPVAKVILISDTSAETVVHELVHAATIDKVQAYYKDPALLSDVEQDAVKRLEGLMEEWLDMDPARETVDGQDARRIAEAEIAKWQAKGNKAAALNEFMAWVLANQDLAEAAQKTKVKNPLLRVIGDVLAAIKTMLWGAPQKGARVEDDLLSNLRFNTRVLIAGPTVLEQLQEDGSRVAMHQSASYGTSDRLSSLNKRINDRILSWIGSDTTVVGKLQRTIRNIEFERAQKAAENLAGIFAFNFPDLGTMQAKGTFTTIQTALMTEVELNPNALSRMEDLYQHVIKELKPADFIPARIKTPNQNDLKIASDKYDAVIGRVGQVTDKLGRSSLMSSFVALAMTSDEFRAVLSKIGKPKSDKSLATGFDGVVENVGLGLVDHLSTMMSGEKSKDRNVRDALDRLMDVMLDNVGDQRMHIERAAEGKFEQFETGLANWIQEAAETVRQKSGEILRNTKNPAVKVGASVANVMATVVNEKSAKEASLGLISQLNKVDGFNPIKELVNDVVGRNRENAPIYDMISKVRAVVQQVRQQFRDELPVKLNSMFKAPVSAEQWTGMFHTLGKTDLAALAQAYGLNTALDMVTDGGRRASEIKALETTIRNHYGSLANTVLAKSDQLARYMVTGDHSGWLLRNATAISRLLGLPGSSRANPTPEIEAAIDRLVSLLALNQVNSTSRDRVAALIDSDRAGVEFVTSYLVGQRTDELAKLGNNEVAILNHYKGHIPSEVQNGGSLIIASDTEYAKLVARGYSRVGDYTGSSADRTLGTRSYYFAPVSGRAPFSQGVMQTVHTTASGIDPETGYTVGETTAGRIESPDLVKAAKKSLPNSAATKENLMPVFDERGGLVAFERGVDPAQMEKLDRSTDLAAMIGAWRGRQAEELLAQEVNRQLVDNLHQIWVEGEKAGRQKEFVNIGALDPKTDDKILTEAASLIPNQTRDYIKGVFGKGQLMVRRDMLLDTFGARQASVGDLFTGQTRWAPGVASTFEKLAAGIFVKGDAYQKLVGTERFVQDVVANIKTTIVVRSVVVPVANMMSNMFQLVNRGVPIRSVIHGIGAKTAEINSYVQRRQREIDLEADLRAAKGKNDFTAIGKLENQLQSIRDSYKRMSIWPLIEAGEFSAISSGQVTAEDLAISNGKWANFIEKRVASLPEPIRTPARYALVTRDTALFQGLARAVQYGDFVAKAVLYDDLVSRKKQKPEEAIATLNEAFVNYNRLAGRTRQYAESIGLLWFYNYKLRIMKEAAYMLRHNPLRSLLVVSVPKLPLIGDLGTPVTDNILALGVDGKLGYSIGPGMGLGVWKLNPWINLVH